MKSSTEKPSWYDVALRTADVKTLWGMWPRLAVRDGLLSRRFVGINEKQERWQIVLPKVLQQEFLAVAHGGMMGGHLGRMKSLGAVQSKAYWPTWSSDVVQFLKRCVPCSQYHRGSVPRRAEMQVPLVEKLYDEL
jgi:hypothetical protein